MRLIKRAEKLEAAGAAAREEAATPAAVALVWTCDDVRIDAGALAEGQYIATDLVHLAAAIDGASPAIWSVRERVTLQAQDVGWVIEGEGGPRVGRVLSMSPSLLLYELDAEPGCELEWRRGDGTTHSGDDEEDSEGCGLV